MASPGLDVLKKLMANPQAQYEVSQHKVYEPGDAGYNSSRGPMYTLGSSVTPTEQSYVDKRNRGPVLGSQDSSLLGG